MRSVSQGESSLKHILEERAKVLARETGCIRRQRKFSGADHAGNCLHFQAFLFIFVELKRVST